ncbi:TOBE domain-containing protein [Endothiovibrio diazotrophicus]
MPAFPTIHGRLTLDTAVGNFLGDTRIRLLEAIDKHGSIARAAKAVPLSYKAAWDAVDTMNSLSPHPLVLRTTGGRHGGGTELTPYCRRLIAFYRALEQEYQGAVERASELLNAGHEGNTDVTGFRRMLARLTTRSSARNQFAGPVESIRRDAVNCEVRIRLEEALVITALITTESAEHLGLRVGREVHAFVKSSSVVLLSGEQGCRLSTRNGFDGAVVRVHRGPVNAEVAVALPGERHVLTALLDLESLHRMEIAEGAPVQAVFKASSVILTAAP